MYRLSALFLALLLFCAPLTAAAQSGIPLFDSEWQLVPEAHEIDPTCPVGYPLGFGGVLQLVQNGMNAAISFGIVAFVLIIAGAGILWMLTPTNPENHSQAKKILTNAVIGFLIILSAWLIVDFVMKLLYDGENSGFGPWNSILTGGDICIRVNENLSPLFTGDIRSVPGHSGSSYDPQFTTSGACSPNSVYGAGQGTGITQKQAQFLACIARPESACGADLTNYQWGSGSSAYGPFMILLDGNSRYFETPACYRAANVTGNLNCDEGFRGGNPIPGSPIAARCMRAAANLACSVSAAHGLLMTSGHRPWTGNHDSTSAHGQCARLLN